MDDFSSVLTKNVRNWVYMKSNSPRACRIANSKLKTKKILAKNGVSVPHLLAIFKTQQDVVNFSWEKLEGNFVVKPVSGSGGEGILVVRKRAKWAGEWFLMDGGKVDIAFFRFHCFDALQGQFNVRGLPDKVFIEERVKIHPKFLRFTKLGTPDVRVIVFNRVPVMAMLRIPTEESNGKANLHQGAIGLGIDLATGITTFAVHNGQLINRIYDRKRKKMIKVNGIKTPFWKKILETAVSCQEAIPSLQYLGVDIVLDKEKGPMVLELNARPGLSIQVCNRAGLRRRLERVAGLKVRSAIHGIKIAQSLFGESFVDRVIAKDGIKIVEVLESIRIKTGDKKRFETIAKIDTGALRTSIDRGLARDLGLLKPGNTLYRRHYRSALAHQHERKVIGLTFWLRGRKIKTAVNVANRSHLNASVLIGRRDLQGFLIRPEPVSTKIKI